jgi:MFS family permease
LIADTSLWWKKFRGIAVAICASGSYLAGAIWPPVTQHYVEAFGWRESYISLGLFCGIGMALLAFFLRKAPPNQPVEIQQANTGQSKSLSINKRPFGIHPVAAQWWLFVAGVACCVAMAMPQVHIVAYCADLGFGPARGAEMLALMLGCGIVSRLFFGWVCDHIGGVKTLLLGSVLQGLALLLFLPFKGLVSLYIVSAMFGLFQGGIVPSYAIIIREHFPINQSGRLVGFVVMGTLFGMALGGWMTGKIFDMTGSYQAAIVNGIGWNILNISIAFWMFWRIRQPSRMTATAA